MFFVSKEELQILGLSFLKNIGALFSLESENSRKVSWERPGCAPANPANLVGFFLHQKAPVRSEDPEWKIGMPWLLKATFSSDSKVRLGERADYWEATSMDHRYVEPTSMDQKYMMYIWASIARYLPPPPKKKYVKHHF